MSPAVRLGIVLTVLAVALAVAWVSRRGIAVRRHPATLPNGLTAPVVFTSETCATCGQVRRILEGLDLDSLTEVVWEQDPTSFEAAGITRVPAFVWSEADGTIWRVDGVASLARLRRWIGDP